MKNLLKKVCLTIIVAACSFLLCSCEYHRPYAAFIGIDLGVNSALHQLDK